MGELKIATRAHLADLIALDRRCFPDGDPTLEPAGRGELERGVERGSVLLVENDDQVVAYLHWEQPGANEFQLTALAVDPDHRRRGLATHLLDACLASLDRQGAASISTVASPGNVAMLRLLLSHGFVARRVMRDYFGPGKDRVYCQRKVSDHYMHPDDRYLVPVDRLPILYDLLDDGRYVLTDVVAADRGQLFEVSRFEEDDRAALQAAEMSVGLTFSAAILAALTFLAAFAFGSSRYPDGIVAMLILAVLTSTISLVIYANASGELARLRSNDFPAYMKWGNLLSEYGGVLPFLLALPLTFRVVADARWATWGVSLLFTAGIARYEWSRFALHARYPDRRRFRLLATMTAVLPAAAAAAPSTDGWMWAWSTLAIVVLGIRFALAVPATFDERARASRPQGWQVRR